MKTLAYKTLPVMSAHVGEEVTLHIRTCTSRRQRSSRRRPAR